MTRRASLFTVWTLAAVIAFAAAGLAIFAEQVLNRVPESGVEVAAQPQAQRPLVAAVAFSAPDAAVAELLGRSPFDDARRPFQRTALDTAPPPPPPPPPKLLGISTSGGARAAMVEWPATGQTQTLKIGIETPIGVVSKIGEADVVFGKGEQAVTVSMFQ